jgi:hypothetical protein
MTPSPSIEVQLISPPSLTRGDPLIVAIRVCNRGKESAKVSARLNLFESDLRIHVEMPNGRHLILTGTHLKDSALNRMSLAPDECAEGSIQIHYTNQGLVFSEPGEYILRAEYCPAGQELILSEPVTISILPESSGQERALSGLTLTEPFGRAISSGDVAGDEEAVTVLETVSKDFGHTSAGRAARLILANTRAEQNDGAEQALQKLSTELSELETTRLALAIAPPGHTPNAPLIQALAKRVSDAEIEPLAKTLASKRNRGS